MLGHIAVPSLDPTGSPATLSAPMATALLRRELGFRGLVVTDALEMAGARRATWSGEAAVQAVRAGRRRDPAAAPPEVAIRALARAVRTGASTESRIDESVERILAAKEALGCSARRRRRCRPPFTRWAVPPTWSRRSTSRGAPSRWCGTPGVCCRCARRSRCGSCTWCSPATRARTGASRASPKTS